MHILLFILFFIIAIIVFGLSIVGFLLRTIFGIGRRSSSSHHGKTGQSQQSYNQGSYNSNDDEEEILSEKNSLIRAAHSSANMPFTTTVLGCKASAAYL